MPPAASSSALLGVQHPGASQTQHCWWHPGLHALPVPKEPHAAPWGPTNLPLLLHPDILLHPGVRGGGGTLA